MAAIGIAPQRIDDLDEEICIHSNYDLRSPHDTSRPELCTYRQILNQVRYWSTFLSLPMKRLKKIHKVLNDEDPEERDDMFHIVMIGLLVVPEMIWIHKKSNRQEDGEGSEEFHGSGLYQLGFLLIVRQRDGGVCCITGKIKAECCYIFPFWTSTCNRIWPMMHLICTFLGPGYKVLASRMQKGGHTTEHVAPEPKSIPWSDVGKGKKMDGVVDDEEPQEIEHGIKIRFHGLPATTLEHMKVDNPHPCTTDPRSLFVPIPFVRDSLPFGRWPRAVIKSIEHLEKFHGPNK
ncbi:hypothetical protein RB213_002120 [Colletotrichum asianum]